MLTHEKKTLPYEEAAEMATVSGWVCKSCGRFWGNDEHIARYCCARDIVCQQCGTRRTEKHYTCCSVCRQANEAARWAEKYKEAIEWDGETPLYSEWSDRFYFSSDDLADHIYDHADEIKEHIQKGGTLAEWGEGLRLIQCKPDNGRPFEMSEYLADSLPTESDVHLDSETIDKAVNDWITEHAPFSWHPSGKPVKVESVIHPSWLKMIDQH